MKLEIKAIKAIKKGDDQINLEFVVRKPNGNGLKSEVIYFFDEDGDYELGDYCAALEERAIFEFACRLFDVDPDDVLNKAYEELKGKKKETTFTFYEMSEKIVKKNTDGSRMELGPSASFFGKLIQHKNDCHSAMRHLDDKLDENDFSWLPLLSYQAEELWRMFQEEFEVHKKDEKS